ncbi:MAG TPA: glycosyltransferase family 4 protein [Acidimicrobiales bacterium]|nr:glycosyltransferase family 4 protein [Acidimicrobiales bacterium]
MATRTRRLLSISTIGDGGGSETALIRVLAALDEAGWQCHVALPPGPRLAAGYEQAGATIHPVPMRRLTLSGSRVAFAAGFAAGWAPSVARLAALARHTGASVVHSNTLHDLYGPAAARAAGLPHVWHAREVVVQSRAALRLERALARRSDAVVAVSHAVAAQLDPANVTVVRDLADPTRFAPWHAGRFRARAGIADGAPLVGAATRIDTWKGVDVLLDAVPAIRAARPDAEIVVAGSPVGGKQAYADGLARRAASLGVHWLGHRDDVADLLADLDVFVQLSTEPEPWGLGLVEALAAGCPVVATAAGGPLEIVAAVPRAAAALVPVGDAVASAAAVVGLLPAGTSTARRRNRPAVVPALDPGPPFAAVLEAVIDRRARRSAALR